MAETQYKLSQLDREYPSCCRVKSRLFGWGLSAVCPSLLFAAVAVSG